MMVKRRARWAEELPSHPVWGLVASLGQGASTEPDSTPLFKNDLAMDVANLLSASEPPLVEEPSQAINLIHDIRENLRQAQTAAAALPIHLAIAMMARGLPHIHITEMIGQLERDLAGKLAAGAEFASELAEHTPADKRKRRNEAAYRVARTAARIFERRAGPAEVKRLRDKTPASEYGRFVEDLYSALEIDAEWFGPAKWAVTTNRSEDAN